jgi:hypothetical protein
MNCTPETLLLSDADAMTETVPQTLAPPAGVVMATVGGVASTGTTAVAWFDGELVFPELSSAMTR